MNVHLPAHLIPSTCLNSRKNKEKSERLVTAFVRVPGRYETGPRYHCYQRSLRKEIGPGEFGRTAGHFDARLVAVSRMDDDLCDQLAQCGGDLLAAVDRAATERAGEVFNRGEVARVTMLGCSATIFGGGARTASSAWAPSRRRRSSGSRERASSSEIVPRAIWSRIRSISRLV